MKIPQHWGELQLYKDGDTLTFMDFCCDSDVTMKPFFWSINPQLLLPNKVKFLLRFFNLFIFHQIKQIKSSVFFYVSVHGIKRSVAKTPSTLMHLMSYNTSLISESVVLGI